MDRNVLIWAIGGAMLLAFTSFAFQFVIWGRSMPQEVACTQEAKLCPDGSYVGRAGPSCEFTVCPDAKDGDGSLFKTTGIVRGRVTIGPLCPVEPCPVEVPNPYLSRKVVLEPQGGGRPVDLPFTIKINSDGSFQGEIPEGNYKVSVTDCQFLGCGYALPKSVRVEANKTVELDIDIDTGIR